MPLDEQEIHLQTYFSDTEHPLENMRLSQLSSEQMKAFKGLYQRYLAETDKDHLSQEKIDQSFTDGLSIDWSGVVFVMKGTEPIGFGTFSHIPEVNEVSALDAYIDPEYRGKGILPKMQDRIEAYAQSVEAECITLQLFRKNDEGIGKHLRGIGYEGTGGNFKKRL